MFSNARGRAMTTTEEVASEQSPAESGVANSPFEGQAAASLAPVLNSKDWQRLSPLAVIHFIVKFVMDFVQGGVQNLAFLGGIVVFTGDSRWLILAGAGLLAVILLLTAGVLSYLNFKFRIDGDAFLIRKGVIQKSRLTLTFDRIQNVALGQPLYFMPFGLVTLALESAGSSGEEVKLAGIAEPLARDIRHHVLSQRRTARHTAAKRAGAEVSSATSETPDLTELTDADVLVAQPLSELVRYGLSNNNIWVVAGVATGALFQQYDSWEPYAIDFVDQNVTPFLGDAPAVLAFAALAGVLVVAAFLMLCSVIGAIVVFYRFKLSHADGRFFRKKGLFERQETSLPDTKIQSLRLNQPWPALLLRRVHGGIKQVGFSGSNVENTSKDTTLIIPSLTGGLAARLVQKVFPGLQWDGITFAPIDPLFVTKTLTYGFLPPALLAAVPLLYFLGAVGALPLLFPLMVLPLVILRWRRYGYFSDGQSAVVRSGLFGTKRTVFAFFKAQGVSLTQSPSQRKRSLATLTILLAGGNVTVPFMPLADAEAWRDRILYEVETSTQPWM